MNAETALDGLRTASAIPWAYRFFEITPDYPFGVMLDDTVKPLFADDKPYVFVFSARLELYDAAPNADAETLTETWLDANATTYKKHPRENVNANDETAPIFMTAYEFEVI